jgi:hypothetical protein
MTKTSLCSLRPAHLPPEQHPFEVRSRARFIVTLAHSVLLGAFLATAHAATYYVDPVAGNNANAGTSPATAWSNPPGTRNTQDSDFFSSSWGPITTSNKLRCGDIVLLKGGSTQTSSHGGAWRLDSNYYSTSCTASSPMQLRVATAGEWPGSNGHFTLNGAGITATCLNNCGDVRALVAIETLGGIEVKGISGSQRLVIRDSASKGVNLNAYGTPNHIVLDFLDVSNAGEVGLAIGGVNYWKLANSLVHGSGGHGIDMGLHVDRQTDFGAIVNSEIYGNGRDPSAVPFNSDGMYIVATKHFWMLNSAVHDEQSNGINGGSVLSGNPQADTYRASIRNSHFFKNGVYPGINSARAGQSWGGDRDVSPPHSYVFHFYNVWYGNPGPGIWAPHDSGREYVWNQTLFGNGHDRRNGDILWERTSDQFELHNSIVSRRPYTSGAWGANAANTIFDVRPLSNFNLYDFASSESEVLSAFRWSGGYILSGVTYANGAAELGFSLPGDKISTAGLGLNPRFVSTGGACDTAGGDYSSCDFRLQAGSPAIDAATFVLRAASGGTNASTITVTKGDPNSSNDPELADPRNFFIAPTSFPGAVGDVIQIQGCGRVTVTSMTSSTISFSPQCSWSSGAGIHLPWNGTAPDIGAYEFGGTATPPTTTTTLPPTGAISAPQLLSVEPLP